MFKQLKDYSGTTIKVNYKNKKIHSKESITALPDKIVLVSIEQTRDLGPVHIKDIINIYI